VWRALFALGLGWAILNLFGEPIYALFPAGRVGAAQDPLAFATCLVAGGIVAGILYAVRPGFLRVPPETPRRYLLGALLIALPVVAVVLAIVAGLLEWIHLLFTGDPEHSQYGLSVLFAILWYPLAGAPAAALVIAWAAARRREARRGTPQIS
jgi:hypothetical protein